MSPPVFVVDTNVVVAGLISGSRGSPVVAVVDAMLAGSLAYMLSPSLLAEYRRVLMRPRLGVLHGLEEPEIDRVLVELTANAIWREPDAVASAPDPGDDHLWALLSEHVGATLITGDRLLVENPPAENQVISPRGWVAAFEGR